MKKIDRKWSDEDIKFVELNKFNDISIELTPNTAQVILTIADQVAMAEAKGFELVKRT